MKKWFVFAALLIMMLSATALAESWYYVVNPDSSWVNLRQEPNSKAKVLAKVDVGEYVVLLDDSNPEWYRVEYGELRGYMMSRFLRLEDGVQGEEYCEEEEEIGQGEHPGLTLVQQLGDMYIFRYEQDGHAIHFISEWDAPVITWEDVNFDDMADIVVMVNQGTSNAYYEFFIWEDGEYVYAERDTAGYLANYQLMPEYGLVQCTGTSGMAGMLFQTDIYRWEGTKLVRVRSAVSDYLEETVWDEDSFTTVSWNEKFRLVVRDYTQDAYEGQVTWEKICPLADMENGLWDQQMESALWNGLR